MVSSLVWSLLGAVLLLMVALRLPSVQDWAGDKVAGLLAEKLGTKVSVGRVDLGFLNRIIIDDVTIYDQHKRSMLEAARITAKIDLAQLAVGRISVSSAQLFSTHLRLSRPTAEAPLNIQFVLDSLASKDTTTHTPLDLRINSLIVRHSSVSYDQEDAPKTTGKFNPRHLHIGNISTHIILKALRDDSLNINVKRLACREQSGLVINKLAFRLTAGTRNAFATPSQSPLRTRTRTSWRSGSLRARTGRAS